MNIALILLGGSGKRFGGEVPKQFLKKNNIPIYLYSVFAYSNLKEIDAILLVTSLNNIEQVKRDLSVYQVDKVIDVITGGSERYISSFNGIKYLYNKYGDDNNVLIADAVRPNISSSIILNNIDLLKSNKAVLTAIIGNAKEQRIDTGHFKNSVSYLAQTPQSFNLGYIYSLYTKFSSLDNFKPTDDINLVEMANEEYAIAFGEENNYKITNKEDFERFIKS